MAYQTGSVTQAEHDFFATRSGLVTSAPLSEHRAKYFSDKGFGGNASLHPTVSQMENDWLASQTGVTSIFMADMWREAVAGKSLTPSVKISENRRIFFSEVAGNP